MIDTNISPDKLKKSILQDAMQGKLTKRSSEDGDATDLLQSIDKEKQRLIKAGKIKKRKKLSPVRDDEIPFRIPNNWEWTRLDNIGTWKSGSTPRRNHPEYYKGDISWLTIHDLNDDYIIDSEEKITQSGFNNSSMQINNPGSVLLAMYGSIGKLGLLKIKATTNQAICACHPHNGIYNKFLFYYLLSQRSGFFSISSGGVQKNISRTKIVHYAFPLPPLAEQKRIVDKLEIILPKVDSFKQSVNSIQALRNELPSRLRRSFLQSAMQGKLTQQLPEDGDAADLLRFIAEEKQQLIQAGKIKKPKELATITDDEIPFKIPDNWKWVRLGDVSIINTGNTPPKKEPKYYNSNDIKFVTPVDIDGTYVNKVNRYLSNNALNKVRIAIPDSIFVIGIGGGLGRVGIATDKSAFNQQLHNIKSLIINFKYIYYCLVSNLAQNQFNNNAGTAIPILNKKRISNTMLPLPPLTEQKRIVNELDALLSKINKI